MSAVCGLARQSMLCKMHEVCPRVCSKGGVCNVFVCVCEVCGLNGARVPTTGARPAAVRSGARSGTLDFRRRLPAPCWRGRACGVLSDPSTDPRRRPGRGAGRGGYSSF